MHSQPGRCWYPIAASIMAYIIQEMSSAVRCLAPHWQSSRPLCSAAFTPNICCLLDAASIAIGRTGLLRLDPRLERLAQIEIKSTIMLAHSIIDRNIGFGLFIEFDA